MINALRTASLKWPARNQCKKEARVERGKYRCRGYKRRSHIVPASVKSVGGSRSNNVFADHIDPVVSPSEGFVDWNTYIDRLFCDISNYQLLCKECHDKKSRDEKKERKK